MPVHRKKTKKIQIPRFIKLFFILGLLSVLLYFYSEFWNGKDKLSVAIRRSSGEILISTFDPNVSEITNVIIPADTQIQLSRQLGIIKAKNIWQLGINEKLGGKLLTESLTNHLKLPVFVFADSNAEGLATNNVLSLIKAVITPYKTNLKIGDRIRLALFSIGIQNSKRVNIELDQTSYLKKSELIGGEEGFIVTGVYPRGLLVIFSDSQISNEGTTVIINDSTKVAGIAQNLGEVIEVLGAKVASIEKLKEEDIYCSVSSKNTDVGRKLASYFSCDISEKSPPGSFDVEFNIGKDFADKF